MPIRGHIPGPPGALTGADIEVAGPLARSVDDLELALDVMAGSDMLDQAGWKLKLANARHEAIRDYRIAVWSDDPFCAVDPEFRDLIEGAGTALEEMGARVDRSARPAVDMRIARDLLQPAGAALVPVCRRACGGNCARTRRTPTTTAIRRSSPVARSWTMRNGWTGMSAGRCCGRCGTAFSAMWMCCSARSCRARAIPHDQSASFGTRTVEIAGQSRNYVDMIVWCGLTCRVYLPATVVPVGRTDAGLPVGVQVVANFMEDRSALHVARHLEKALGGVVPPPGFA